MDNEETPTTPLTSSPTPPIPTLSPTEPTPIPTTTLTPEASIQSPADNATTGAWVSKEQYDAYVAEAEKQRISEIKKSNRIRVFYILLAISGFMLFVMYLGMLIWPFHYASKGSCSENFFGIAFWLNPLGYLALLTTGIVGTTIQYRAIRPLSIIFIIVSPIGWFITGAVIIFSALCGV